MGLQFFGDVMYLYWIVGLTVIVLIKKPFHTAVGKVISLALY
jgi:predicted metal-binding membrane protein